MKALSWCDGAWLSEPPTVRETADGLTVEAARGSDFWRTTHYGFRRDTGHALLFAYERDSAMEVTFGVDYDQLYDQAGILVRLGAREWVKAGVEISDGSPQVGAVVTHESSDWSCAPAPDWAGATVTVRASWRGDALTVRARSGEAPWRTVRLAHFDPHGAVLAGPYCASPQRAGMRVRFVRTAVGAADAALHLD